MKIMSHNKVAELIDRNTDGRIDVRRLKGVLEQESKYWQVQTIPLSSLKGIGDVDHRLAKKHKGPIVVRKDGEVIDGRHRAAAAMQDGETSIEAYVPIQPPVSKRKV